ncbi:Gfo/Idh/MocA family protein [Pedosphaera parvula]|nr:Gfo/Idh/MocA family oxidoreductase [Pedosphaera parvula]
MNLRAILLGFLSLSASAGVMGAELRIGIIGCDTSHATAFTKIFNDPTDKNHVEGAKVVVFYKGGSADIKDSADRVEKIAGDLREKYGVKEMTSVDDLCKEVDVVLLESLDGRPKLEQVRPVLKAHKPVFIDKPIASSLKEVLEINRLAKESKTPWFSSSAYRFYNSMVELKGTNVGTIMGAISYGPCELEEHHPDFFWYGIHPTEALFTVMGPDCVSVVRTSTPDTDVATGVWAGGRVGTFRGARNSSVASVHKVTVFGSKAVVEQAKGTDDYAPLVRQIMNFFQTGIAPVPNEETIAIYAFMEAADESKRQGGKSVKIADVISRNGGL